MMAVVGAWQAAQKRGGEHGCSLLHAAWRVAAGRRGAGQPARRGRVPLGGCAGSSSGPPKRAAPPRSPLAHLAPPNRKAAARQGKAGNSPSLHHTLSLAPMSLSPRAKAAAAVLYLGGLASCRYGFAALPQLNGLNGRDVESEFAGE